MERKYSYIGTIQNYVIAIHEVETGRNFTAHSNTTQVTLEPLHPYYTYMCSIAAETVGRGPFSEHITIQLPEAGLTKYNNKKPCGHDDFSIVIQSSYVTIGKA